METGERPVVETFEEMSSLMIETYKLCKTYTEGKEVLDVGCGEGEQDLFLSDTVKHIHAIDYDGKVILKNKNKFSEIKSITFHHMSGEKIDFPDNMFDVVISAQSIEHIKEDDQFVRETHRVLKHGGIFICTTPNKLALIPEGEKEYDAPIYPFHFREYKPDQFFGLLKQYFTDVEKNCFYCPIGNPPPNNHPRIKFIYRISRFGLVKWVARNLPVKIKQGIGFFGTGKLKEAIKIDYGTAYGPYSDELVPHNLCAICKKL